MELKKKKIDLKELKAIKANKNKQLNTKINKYVAK